MVFIQQSLKIPLLCQCPAVSPSRFDLHSGYYFIKGPASNLKAGQL